MTTAQRKKDLETEFWKKDPQLPPIMIRQLVDDILLSEGL